MFNSIISALCICIGFYFGFKIGRTGELPKRKTRQQIKQEDEDKKKISKFEKSLGNIDRYDGSSNGQEDIE